MPICSNRKGNLRKILSGWQFQLNDPEIGEFIWKHGPGS